MLDKVLAFFNREVGPAQPELTSSIQSIPAPPANPTARVDRQAQADTHQYAPIQQALNACVEHLIRVTIPTHRAFVENDVLELHYLEIEAKHDQGKRLLDEFCAEFTPEARKKWVCRHLGSTNAALKLDCFAGLIQRGGGAPIPAPDPRLRVLNLEEVSPEFSARLYSRWLSPDGAAHTLAPLSAFTDAPFPLIARVSDAAGAHPEQHFSRYPIRVGRVDGELLVAGNAVSRRHFVLHWNAAAQVVEVEECSTNGSWLNGERLHRQRRCLPPGRHRLKLGSLNADAAAQRPEIELEIVAPALDQTTPLDFGETRTPIDFGDGPDTPEAAQPLLAVLRIEDATGTPQGDVVNLPFTLGRNRDRDYVIPPSHSRVSGKHLTINNITEAGAWVSNEAYAKNGINLGPTSNLQPENFLWPFGETIRDVPDLSCCF